MTDMIREKEFNQKRGICLFAVKVEEGTESYELAAGNLNNELANLPPDAVITDAYIHVETVSDAATSAAGTLGTTSGGTEILSAANLKTAGDQGTFTGQSLTGTGKTLWLGVAKVGAETAVGVYIVVVEYVEFLKKTGEYTTL